MGSCLVAEKWLENTSESEFDSLLSSLNMSTKKRREEEMMGQSSIII
jgi:hypothetical protein